MAVTPSSGSSCATWRLPCTATPVLPLAQFIVCSDANLCTCCCHHWPAHLARGPVSGLSSEQWRQRAPHPHALPVPVPLAPLGPPCLPLQVAHDIASEEGIRWRGPRDRSRVGAAPLSPHRAGCSGGARSCALRDAPATVGLRGPVPRVWQVTASGRLARSLLAAVSTGLAAPDRSGGQHSGRRRRLRSQRGAGGNGRGRRGARGRAEGVVCTV